MFKNEVLKYSYRKSLYTGEHKLGQLEKSQWISWYVLYLQDAELEKKYVYISIILYYFFLFFQVLYWAAKSESVNDGGKNDYTLIGMTSSMVQFIM